MSNAGSAMNFRPSSKQLARRKTREILRLVARAVRPAPSRSPDQWADEKRRLPEGSAEGDRYRSSRTPYLIPFMRAMANTMHSRVIGVVPSQGGKSNAIFNSIGQTLDDQPMPLLYIAPSKELAMTVVEPKIDDMFRNCPSLWEKVAKGKRYTRAVKRVDGISFRLAWGGSTSQLKGDTAWRVYVDEVDEFDPDINNQGSIMELADARHASYTNGMTIAISTPTEGNVNTYTHPLTGLVHWEVAEADSLVSQIWAAWQLGSRHEWAWPCPHCRHYFIPRFDVLKFDSQASHTEIELMAHVECPRCSHAIATNHRMWMNDHGCPVAPGQYVYPYVDGHDGVHIVDAEHHGEIPERDDPRVHFMELGDYRMPEHGETSDCSMWCSGLAHFSARRTFGNIANGWLRAVRSGNPSSIKTVLNTTINECFKFGGDAPELDDVRACRGTYVIGSTPEWVTQAFVTADVQDDRVPYTVRGFGVYGQSALLEHGELWGDTQDPATLRQLDQVLMRKFGNISIRAGAIDSGNRSNVVYEYCRSHAGLLVPTKGRDVMDKPFYASKIDVKPDGQTVKYSLQLWHVNTDMAKCWVHSRMVIDTDEAGAWYLPMDVDDYYMKQIIAEQRIKLPSGKIRWHKTGRNDYLDCEALQWFLFRCLGPVQSAPKASTAPGVTTGPRVHSTGVEV